MESLPNTQTTLNGGGTRPRLDWEMLHGNSVGNTRKCVPIEAARIRSTSDSYLAVAEQYNSANDPKFAFKCVNNGIPQRTCSAVDSTVLLYLRRIHYRKLEKQLGEDLALLDELHGTNKRSAKSLWLRAKGVAISEARKLILQHEHDIDAEELNNRALGEGMFIQYFPSLYSVYIQCEGFGILTI